jgi:hypothetical protein
VRSAPATIEAFDHARAGKRRWLAVRALMLGALALQPIAAVIAQEPARDEVLIERLRQIQGEPTPGATEPTPESNASTGAAPTLGEDEVRSLIVEGLGVEVLKIKAIESGGRPAYAVTVMNPAGNADGAFAVETLLIDGATGGLLGRVSQVPRTAAPGLAEPSGRAAPDSTGLEIRRRTWR